MTAARMRPFVTKEIRALLPAWIASACAIGAAVLGGPRGHGLGLAAYALGSVALGAQSVGHEYTHRTLTLLLSQPSSRRQLYLVKLGVLTTMLLTLAAFARLTLLGPRELEWMLASVLNGLCLAPLITMLCRNPLAGVVFTGAAPFWPTMLGTYLSGSAVWGGTVTVCAAAAVASWRLFMRLEAIDGPDPDVMLPPMLRRRTAAIGVASGGLARAPQPVWLLVKKELRLQQLTFAVAAVWLLIWSTVSALRRIVPTFAEFPLPAVGILYGALLALLIGSLASAEERQIGTLEWQMLLPMAAWKQWALKVGTILALSGLLSVALPVVFAAGTVGASPWHAGVILVLTIGSLYVSSLCRTAVRALVVSGPIMLTVSLLLLRVAIPEMNGSGPRPLLALPVAVVLALMLWFALENHRSAGHSSGRVSRQILWMAGCLGLGIAVVTALP